VKHNLTKQEFGELTVRESVGRRKGYGNAQIWLCDCACGGTTLAVGWALKKGRRVACNNPIHKKKHRNWKGCGDLSASFFGWIKNGAEYRKIPFALTIESAWQLFLQQDKRCALTGVFLVMETDVTHHRDTHTASLDRINSSCGYMPGNIQWVHKDINNMKQTMTTDEFVAWCRRVVEHAEEKY
jgi:hypothetical protein